MLSLIKNVIRFFLVSVLLLLAIPTFATTYTVRTIFFKPTDVAAQSVDLEEVMENVQSSYASEMNRNGFGNKTFQLEEDTDGDVIVHEVIGKYRSTVYRSNMWQQISSELPQEFKRQDNIHVIVVGGLSTFYNGVWGIGWPIVGGHQYGGYVIATENPSIGVEEIIEHELGHTFGLYHNLIVDDNDYIMGTGITMFHEHETRWLSKHHYFNTDRKFNAAPTISKVYPLQLAGNKVKLNLDVSSPFGLHQAQVFRSSDVGVLDWEYLEGNTDTIRFEFDRLSIFNESSVVVEIMDMNGNYLISNQAIIMPRQENKNDDLIKNVEIPGIVRESVDDNIVYLTINDGDTPLPNEFGLKPHNPIEEYKNGWRPENIVDNGTTHKKPISIRGSLFERGISLTPPSNPESSVLKYDLSGNDYTQFQSYIGITDDHQHTVNNNTNQSCNVGGSAIFVFHIDDVLIFESEVLTGTMEAQYIKFDIPEGAETLTITINSSLDGNWCDNPAVGDAKLVVEGTVNTKHQIAVSAKEKLTTQWARIKSVDKRY